MKEFLAIYRGTSAALEHWKSMDEATRRQREGAGRRAWSEWMKLHEQDVVDPGTPIGKTKRVSAQGITDVKNEIGAYVIVQAETQEDAAKLFENHPHFTIFPGDSVEIMECLPMPKMQ